MKIIKFLSVILVFAILICSFSGCKEESGYPVLVGDVEIFDVPQTVAVLSEHAASAICALGYRSYLVGAPTEFFKTDKLSLSFEVFPPKTDTAFESVKHATEEIAKLRHSADTLKAIIKSTVI